MSNRNTLHCNFSLGYVVNDPDVGLIGAKINVSTICSHLLQDLGYDLRSSERAPERLDLVVVAITTTHPQFFDYTLSVRLTIQHENTAGKITHLYVSEILKPTGNIFKAPGHIVAISGVNIV